MSPEQAIIVPTVSECLWVARTVEDMAEGLAFLKGRLGLSDALCEKLAGMAEGTINKYLGPSHFKKLGPTTIPLINGALAAEWHLHIDPVQLAVMEKRWEARQGQYVQPKSRAPSKQIIERAKPHVLEASGKHANAARNRMLTREQKIKIARKAARARWRKRRKAGKAAEVME